MKGIITLLIFCGFQMLEAQPSLQGQASLWGIYNDDQQQLGIRYIPEMMWSRNLRGVSLDIDLALQGFRSWNLTSWEYDSEEKRLQYYRAWVRVATDRFECRLGLQKINFGSAQLFRPLMWFDEMDPRDPLQLTRGVYGLLSRIYFLNSTNLWFWILYGNNRLKGWEMIPTREKSPEFGGRVQIPAGPGEVALTLHRRIQSLTETIENRLALDGRWDIEIGIWFEVMLLQQDNPLTPAYQTMGTAGADYTWGIGNGLYTQTEHFTVHLSDQWPGAGITRKFTALSLAYPFSLFDQFSAILFYDWHEDSWYRFLRWQRTYDNWQIHLIGFWNPDLFQLIQFRTDQSLFMGKGVQLLVVFNH
jgi:hypothetical protein